MEQGRLWCRRIGEARGHGGPHWGAAGWRSFPLSALVKLFSWGLCLCAAGHCPCVDTCARVHVLVCTRTSGVIPRAGVYAGDTGLLQEQRMNMVMICKLCVRLGNKSNRRQCLVLLDQSPMCRLGAIFIHVPTSCTFPTLPPTPSTLCYPSSHLLNCDELEERHREAGAQRGREGEGKRREAKINAMKN